MFLKIHFIKRETLKILIENNKKQYRKLSKHVW